MRSLLVINQVVRPLNCELLEDLGAAGVRCSVLVGWVDGDAGAQHPFRILRSVALVKSPLWKRLATWSVFAAHALVLLFRHARTPALVVKDPPLTMLALPLLKRLTGLRYALLLCDIYPDVGEWMGMLRPGRHGSGDLDAVAPRRYKWENCEAGGVMPHASTEG